MAQVHLKLVTSAHRKTNSYTTAAYQQGAADQGAFDRGRGRAAANCGGQAQPLPRRHHGPCGL